MEKAISHLKAMRGLKQVKVLNNEHKKEIMRRESKNNEGVSECLKKKTVIILVHDSEFREAVSELVIKKNDEVYFPALPFPELVNAISSSPSKAVHDFLVKEYDLVDDPEFATILIGFEELL